MIFVEALSGKTYTLNLKSLNVNVEDLKLQLTYLKIEDGSLTLGPGNRSPERISGLFKLFFNEEKLCRFCKHPLKRYGIKNGDTLYLLMNLGPDSRAGLLDDDNQVFQFMERGYAIYRNRTTGELRMHRRDMPPAEALVTCPDCGRRDGRQRGIGEIYIRDELFWA